MCAVSRLGQAGKAGGCNYDCVCSQAACLTSVFLLTSPCMTDCFNLESAVPAAGLTFQLRYHVSNTPRNPWITRMYLKAKLMQWDLKRSHFTHTLPRGPSVTWGLCQSSLRVVFSDPFALGAALALDAAFNLRICGNREDFLSTDPLAPSVRNP